MEKDGHTYELRVEPLIEQEHHTGDILWVIDLTKHYEELNQARKESTHDSLTGLHNRKWFYETVSADIDSHPGAFFILDLDHFKQVNDNFGHQVGDLILTLVAKSIREAVNAFPDATIYAGRLGGDEFLLYFSGETKKEVLSDFATIMTSSFAEVLKENDFENLTSMSVGISIVKEGEGYEENYRKADHGLYKAKNAGRNTFVFEE